MTDNNYMVNPIKWTHYMNQNVYLNVVGDITLSNGKNTEYAGTINAYVFDDEWHEKTAAARSVNKLVEQLIKDFLKSKGDYKRIAVIDNSPVGFQLKKIRDETLEQLYKHLKEVLYVDIVILTNVQKMLKKTDKIMDLLNFYSKFNYKLLYDRDLNTIYIDLLEEEFKEILALIS